MVQSKAARTRQKLAKLKSQVLGIAATTKIDDNLSQAERIKVSQRQLWNDHVGSIGREEAFVGRPDTRIANAVRFAWFPLSLILVLLGAKWGSEMGIVRRIDELHAENQHLKAQENIAHCLEDDYSSESSAHVDVSSVDIGVSTIHEIESGLLGSHQEDPVYRLKVLENQSVHKTVNSSATKHSRHSHSKDDMMLVATNVTQVNPLSACNDDAVDDRCEASSSTLAAQDDERCSDSDNGEAISTETLSMTLSPYEKAPVSSEVLPQDAASAVVPAEDGSSEFLQPIFTPSPTNASWRLSWATVDSEAAHWDVASKNDGCHALSPQSQEDLVAERKETQLIPWLSCVSCETSALRQSSDSTGLCSQSVKSVRMGINLSWQCNSPECVALFSSQLQLIHSFEERALQSEKPVRLQSDSRLGATTWQLSWSTYLQKVVTDAGAEMSLLARSTCGRYAEYFQQVVDDAAKALHKDRSVTWRLPWFGSRSSQRQDLPLFASPVSFFDKEDMFHPKATWRLVWTQSML